jgi:hypothetical protein
VLLYLITYHTHSTGTDDWERHSPPLLLFHLLFLPFVPVSADHPVARRYQLELLARIPSSSRLNPLLVDVMSSRPSMLLAIMSNPPPSSRHAFSTSLSSWGLLSIWRKYPSRPSRRGTSRWGWRPPRSSRGTFRRQSSARVCSPRGSTGPARVINNSKRATNSDCLIITCILTFST